MALALQIPDFSLLRVLVVGDVMLDRYWTGVGERISPEAPVLVVNVQGNREYPGGASNVAMNLAALGVQTSLAGIVGDDTEGHLLQERLQQAGVKFIPAISDQARTTVKLRVIGQNQQLIRLDFEQKFSSADAQRLCEQVIEQLADFDLVIASDYDKGSLQAIQTLITHANALKIPVLIDPKGREYQKYQGAFLLSPNRKEFELAFGECENEQALLENGQKALELWQLQALLITRGAAGMTLFQRNKSPVTIPAIERQIFDVTGAGDTVIATLAAGFSAGQSLEDASRLANLAASIAVQKLGAQPVHRNELQAALHSSENALCKCLALDIAAYQIDEAKARGEKVVFTNGCFDILHPGHIQYLEQAKALGDRLVIAVNDDDSVRRLKGNGRPVNSLATRMHMLAALSTVDWVVSFSEDTPQHVIEILVPNVLVKGGDYQPENMVGSDVVLNNGGEVHALTFFEGYSTTHIVEKIQNTIVERETITE